MIAFTLNTMPTAQARARHRVVNALAGSTGEKA